MVVFNEENFKKVEENPVCGEMIDNLKQIAKTTESEEELFELIKFCNPFVNREIAKNDNVTVNVLKELLENHSAYTMNINIALNKNLTEELKTKLYDISETQYKESMLKKDLDKIFNK